MKWVGLDVCVWEQDRELEEGARLEEDKGNVGSDLTMERKTKPLEGSRESCRKRSPPSLDEIIEKSLKTFFSLKFFLLEDFKFVERE